MLKKRFIGVITVRNGWAVQSFGYRRYLPIGHPTVVAETLDRWGVDEILVLAIDRSAMGLGPDLGLLSALGELGLSTPLMYGGGIHRVEQASQVVRLGVERVCVDAALHGDRGALREISLHIGSQALVASLPLGIESGQVQWYNHVTQTQCTAKDALAQIFGDGLISEGLVIDWRHEGALNGFDMNLLYRFPVPGIPLIAFGGLSETAQIEKALCMPQVVAIGIGNFLNYTEHSVQHYKERLASAVLRRPEYQGPEG
jgi:imidazole glycerol-phosphate synthase subunit HisF